MKITTLLLFLMMPKLFAQDVSRVQVDIGVNGKRETLKCEKKADNLQKDSLHMDLFLCERKGNKYYIRHIREWKEWSGIEFGDTGVSPVVINQIKEDKKSIYKSIFNSSGDDLKESESLADKFQFLENIKGNYSELFSPSSLSQNVEIKEFQRDIKLSIEEEFKNIRKAFSTNSVNVVLSNGKKISCQKGKNNGGPCLHYLCSGISDNGQVFDVALRGQEIDALYASPYLVSANENRLGPDLEISEIKNSNQVLYKSNYFSSPSREESHLLPEEYKKSSRNYAILTDAITSIYRKSEIEKCDDPKLKKFEDNLQDKVSKMESDLQEIKLVELVENINGVFKSRVVLETDISSNMCHMGGDVYFYDENDYTKDVERKFTGFEKNAQVISRKELEEAFKFAIDQKDIPYGYYQDGCFARAHILCYRLEEKLGIDTEKIWARGPVSPPNDDSMSWTYHVATKVNVKEDDGKIQGYVLDPSVASKPLLESEWLSLISTNKKTAQMKTSWPPFQNTGAIKNIQVSYSPNEIYRFSQREDMLTPNMLSEDRKSALLENEKYRSYLDDEN